MRLFTKNGKKLQEIDEVEFKLERELQDITEQNIESVLGIDFVKREMVLGKFRIDTLGFDRDSASFVIIEYKRDKTSSVIDQGMAYLSLLLGHKAEFILVYNEGLGKSLRKDDVDWTQSKVVFVARSFTQHQKQASSFQDMPIELYEVRSYVGGLISLDHIQVQKTESIKTFRQKSKNKKQGMLHREITTYTEEQHLEKISQKTREIYFKVKQGIELLDDRIEIMPKKLVILFKAKRKFVWMVLRKNHIDVTLAVNPDLLSDPRDIVEDVTNIGHWGGGNSRVRIKEISEIPYLQNLIEQAYSASKKKR